MRVEFTKMHGLGNDFMVIDAVTQEVHLTDRMIEQLGDRHFGIGFDQLLVVEPPTRPDVDFRYRIYNNDGTEVEQCGNGARCFARFVVDKGLTHKTVIPVETAGGLIELRLTEDGLVQVDMGRPQFNPDRIPFEADQQLPQYRLQPEACADDIELSVLSMGNPHAVLLVDDLDTAPVAELGPILESHPRFPARVNVGFLQVLSRGHMRLRVFERGVGETLACGSGACAAMVAAHRLGLVDDSVSCILPGGTLRIEWSGQGNVLMTGPAETVFDGRIQIKDS